MDEHNCNVDDITTAARGLEPLSQYAHECHAASIQLVRLLSTVGYQSRVARGWCKGVGGQHSWVVLGMDCYDDEAEIVDPTLWSYEDGNPRIWIGGYKDGRHCPHGKGSIWQYGSPGAPEGPPIKLTPRRPLSVLASCFLDSLGPLDYRGWAVLAHSPVEGWPAAEIIDAIANTEGLAALVPIDIVGMLTDRNPRGLYLP